MSTTLLALETATQDCGVALVQEGTILAELTISRPRVHAEMLVPAVQEILRFGGVAVQSLRAVVVSQGPGSYTGLRIGTSTAKGLALAVGADLVAVPTLEAVAATTRAHVAVGEVVCAVFRARRQEVYAAAFLCHQPGRLEPLRPTAVVSTPALAGWLDHPGKVWLVGNGVGEAAPALQGIPKLDVRVLDTGGLPSVVSQVARLGEGRLAAGNVEDLATFEPFYLKEFVAKKPAHTLFDKLTF